MTRDATANEGPQYWAFISYSHKDAAFGRRLHSRLESYALPRRLVGRVTHRSTVPKRLVPIFRDREEFSAARDLSTEVQAALRASRTLIVVCSPSAKASPWVGREIELFRKLHPDRPVLAAIRDGEPADCFPSILLQGSADGAAIEPLAADFRRGRDGEQLGLLKLVAGIAGIGLDEIVQRDAHRRNQRVTAITAGALLVALIMSLTAIFAINARNEAEHQRGEAQHEHGKADGLVGFMLTDLRTKLKSVGRLDIMTAVNERALRYFADEDLKSMPPASLEKRATTLLAMGEDDEERGELKRASSEIREASRTTFALLAMSPSDPVRIFAQAQSEYWTAFIDWRSGRLPAAEIGFDRYAAMARRLIQIDPHKPEWRMEAGWADQIHGVLLLRDKNDPARAETRFTLALQNFQAALKVKLGDSAIQREIADTYAWLADAQRALGRTDQALYNRQEEGRLIRAMIAADPKNALLARDLLGNELGLARVEFEMGRIADARNRLYRDYHDATRLAAEDPANQKVAKQKIVVGLFLADMLLADASQKGDLGVDAASLLRDCSTGTAHDEQELRDFCAVVSAKMAIANGRIDDPSFVYLRRNELRLRAIAFSPRWGISFTKQMITIDIMKRR